MDAVALARWAILIGLAGCASIARPEQNAAELARLPASATCQASLPFFGYYRYTRDEALQYAEPDGRIVMGNDGGWCMIGYQVMTPSGGFTVSEAKVTAPPADGSVVVGTLHGLLRIAYRPTPGFTGPDQFTVTLLGPIPYTVPVRITVTPSRS